MKIGHNCDRPYGRRWDPRLGCWVCRECHEPAQEQPGRPSYLFKTGKSFGYPECCVRAFSLGRNFVDAMSDLGCAGFTDEQAKILLASVDHVPCSQCLARMTMREDAPS